MKTITLVVLTCFIASSAFCQETLDPDYDDVETELEDDSPIPEVKGPSKKGPNLWVGAACAAGGCCLGSVGIFSVLITPYACIAAVPLGQAFGAAAGSSVSYFMSGLSPNVSRLLVVGAATAVTSLAVMVPASIVTARNRVETGPNSFEVTGQAGGIVIGLAALGAVVIPASAVGAWVITKGMDEPKRDSFSQVRFKKTKARLALNRPMAY